ncbi:MAG: hypothetical protein A4E45_00046 [Methanosaeta sp. PtaB.Bin039]|nr:MAG: hypothetical protein A4E45_00046 [Methanosaeta sp. PtaB.Bin039]
MTAFSNSYIASDTELEAMIGDDPRAAAISLKAAAASAQAWYCREATRRIDALPLRGGRYEEPYIENGSQSDVNADGLIQTLEFPRSIDGVTCDWDNGTSLPIVPELVKLACLEEAIAIVSFGSSGRLSLQSQGVKSYSIGGKLSETFRDGAGSEVLSSPQATRYMRRYIGVVTR